MLWFLESQLYNFLAVSQNAQQMGQSLSRLLSGKALFLVFFHDFFIGLSLQKYHRVKVKVSVCFFAFSFFPIFSLF